MKNFISKKEALKYANEELTKNTMELAMVEEKMTLLTATSLPISNALRDKFEQILRCFIQNYVIDEETNRYYVRPCMGSFALYEYKGNNQAEVIFTGTEFDCEETLKRLTEKEVYENGIIDIGAALTDCLMNNLNLLDLEYLSANLNY